MTNVYPESPLGSPVTSQPPAAGTAGDGQQADGAVVTICGYSDDLVEVGGCVGADEFSSDDWQADLIAPDGSAMRVHCRYESHGCWSVGVVQVDEDHQLPDWTTVITQAHAMNPDNPGYSAMLTIDAPLGTRLRPLEDGA